MRSKLSDLIPENESVLLDRLLRRIKQRLVQLEGPKGAASDRPLVFGEDEETVRGELPLSLPAVPPVPAQPKASGKRSKESSAASSTAGRTKPQQLPPGAAAGQLAQRLRLLIIACLLGFVAWQLLQRFGH